MDLPLYVNQDDFVDDAHGSDSLESGKTGRKGVKGCYRMGSICSMAGLMVTILGLIGIFVILPVLTYIGVANTGSKATLVSTDPDHLITDQVYPLLRHRGLIDPTTPRSALSRRGVDGDMLELVFSDEFSEDGRTFYEGDDAFWTAPDLWYGATRDLEWYSPDAVTTKSGTLRLQMDQFANHNLSFRSGMLNSWNQLCMKGGALEVSVSLPGPASTPGLWGGVWTLGNLGRPGYRASTEGVWPYTYGECDAGITPNQSSPDGISRLPGQRLPACTCAGEEHPNPGMGRGAPEIDVLEAGADPRNRLGLVTQSYQVAPFDIWYRPNYDYMAFPDNEMTELNDYCGGPFQQAISGTTTLNPKWYDDEEYQRYGFEYSASPSDGQIAWFVGDVMSFKMHGNATGPNGNVGRRSISQEPMAMVLNLGMSEGWSEIDYANLKFPTIMYIDYVRWYQKAGESSVTCDPPGYPTTEYIQQHPLAYTNSNLTTWDETGYGWPKHELNGGC
ncbi:MAG: hypothetical protein M1817_003248 [Caeruleum heppii]|nr:MAG: hypothetical protein M1817_003248 [Caeruleum heppii]